MPTNAPLNRKLRMGLVGGGQGAFIGRVHATAAVLDNRAALVAGALSSDPAKAKASAPDYDIPPDRAYGSYKEMAAQETKRPDKVDFVSVATPNHTHFDIARTFAEIPHILTCRGEGSGSKFSYRPRMFWAYFKYALRAFLLGQPRVFLHERSTA